MLKSLKQSVQVYLFTIVNSNHFRRFYLLFLWLKLKLLLFTEISLIFFGCRATFNNSIADTKSFIKTTKFILENS